MSTPPRQALIGWAFVAAQAVLLGSLIIMPGGNDWENPALVRWIARAAFLLGLVVIGAAALNLGSALTPTPVPKQTQELRTGGLYRFVRHPIYSGVLLVVVGMAIGSERFLKLAIGIVTIAFFSIKARWEEARLRAMYPTYEIYAANTPRFVPFPTSLRRRQLTS